MRPCADLYASLMIYADIGHDILSQGGNVDANISAAELLRTLSMLDWKVCSFQLFSLV